MSCAKKVNGYCTKYKTHCNIEPETMCAQYSEADYLDSVEVRDLKLALELIKEQKQKIDELEYILLGVMHSVDKWLDGDELEQDEVNRAITMREKTLQIIEKQQAENDRLKTIEKEHQKLNGELRVEIESLKECERILICQLAEHETK